MTQPDNLDSPELDAFDLGDGRVVGVVLAADPHHAVVGNDALALLHELPQVVEGVVGPTRRRSRGGRGATGRRALGQLGRRTRCVGRASHLRTGCRGQLLARVCSLEKFSPETTKKKQVGFN